MRQTGTTKDMVYIYPMYSLGSTGSKVPLLSRLASHRACSRAVQTVLLLPTIQVTCKMWSQVSLILAFRHDDTCGMPSGSSGALYIPQKPKGGSCITCWVIGNCDVMHFGIEKKVCNSTSLGLEGENNCFVCVRKWRYF